jgi:cation diffusion facilitator CzcD-associated flavoprotein CzcO
MEYEHQTVLIIGAGIAGLALAQGLKKVCNTPNGLL